MYKVWDMGEVIQGGAIKSLEKLDEVCMPVIPAPRQREPGD
jgi:hypothetical protein